MGTISTTILCDDTNGQAYYGLDNDETFDADDGEFESAEYIEICTSDAGYVQDFSATATMKPYHRFDFTIPLKEMVGIRKLEITMKSLGYTYNPDYGFLPYNTEFFVKQNGIWDLRYDGAEDSPVTYIMQTISSNIWLSDNHVQCCVRGGLPSVALGYGGYIDTYYVELKVYNNKGITFIKTSNNRGLTMIKSNNGNLNLT